MCNACVLEYQLNVSCEVTRKGRERKMIQGDLQTRWNTCQLYTNKEMHMLVVSYGVLAAPFCSRSKVDLYSLRSQVICFYTQTNTISKPCCVTRRVQLVVLVTTSMCLHSQ